MACALWNGTICLGRVIIPASLHSNAKKKHPDFGLIDRRPDLTAIVAANDLLALGACDALRERGLPCPERISVTGFNDMPFADKFNPALTTVRIPEYEIGKRAARLLLGRIEDPDLQPETILIAPELVVRGSTSPADAVQRSLEEV